MISSVVFLGHPFLRSIAEGFSSLCLSHSSSYLGVNLPKAAAFGKKYSPSWLKCLQSAVIEDVRSSNAIVLSERLKRADGKSCA